ncbi:16968_t:CDS:2, partial [Acaulospora colombiana]
PHRIWIGAASRVSSGWSLHIGKVMRSLLDKVDNSLCDLECNKSAPEKHNATLTYKMRYMGGRNLAGTSDKESHSMHVVITLGLRGHSVLLGEWGWHAYHSQYMLEGRMVIDLTSSQLCFPHRYILYLAYQRELTSREQSTHLSHVASQENLPSHVSVPSAHSTTLPSPHPRTLFSLPQ